MTSPPASEPTRSYSFYWHRTGRQAGERLTNVATDLTDLAFHLDADPGTTGVDLLHVTPMFEATGGKTSVSAKKYTLETGMVASPLYDTSRTTFDVGLEPNSWSGRFDNTPGAVRVGPAFGGVPFGVPAAVAPSWYFVGQTMDLRAARQVPFTLRQGETVIRTGTFPNTGASLPALPVAPGRYTVDIEGPAGTLDGQKTTTSVRATFDTSAAGRNPPTLSHFRILSGDVPTKDLCLTERGEVRFRITDDVALGQVRFAFRFGGHSQWLPWPLQVDGEDHVARLPLGAANLPNVCRGAGTKAIPVDVRIEATDAQGNSLETEMTPAYARRVPQWNPAPLVLETP